MHAHFDCFSGAAGDMLLAALIDAAQDRTEFLGMIWIMLFVFFLEQMMRGTEWV